MEYFEMDITEKEKDLYGDQLILLTGTLTEFLSCMEMLRRYRKAVTGRDPVSSCRARIKKADSMTEKLRRMGLEVCRENALQKVYDAAGVRIICPFVEDVYSMVDLIMEIPGVRLFQAKDYIASPKPNGYRSYHMIIHFPLRFMGEAGADNSLWLELQLRTIAMDCWASIEHGLKYKKDICNQEFMKKELKRCADEIASTDLSLSTIREMIRENQERRDGDKCVY